MTSKEKLRYIFNASTIDSDLALINEYYDDVLNDLEVLEIIKKYWSIDMNSSFQVSISYKPTSPMGLLPTDELLKLKEWLENDK